MGHGIEMKVVFDTNVLVAAARSRRGASYALVSSIPSPKFQLCLSVSLYAEWQEVLTRCENLPPGLTAEDALQFYDISRALLTYRKYISIGGLFCRIQMMTCYWNWLSRQVAAIL